MALEYFVISRITVTFIVIISIVSQFCRGSGSNTSFPIRFAGHEFNVPFAPAVTDLKGDYPFKDIGLDEVRFLPPLQPGHESNNVFGASVSRTRDPEGFNEDDDSDVAYQPIRNGYYPFDMKMDLTYSPSNGFEKNKTTSKRQKTKSALGTIRERMLQYLDRRGGEVNRQFSSMSFPSLEAALLSLAFLTFAVFLIDLVQDLFSGTKTGRKRRADEGVDDGMVDVIVLALSSIDTLSFGSQNPNCGQKLLCHLNRSGWHDGFLGTASNYFVSLILSLFSPNSGFQKNLDAAQFGKESHDCTARYSACPSVLADLLPT